MKECKLIRVTPPPPSIEGESAHTCPINITSTQCGRNLIIGVYWTTLNLPGGSPLLPSQPSFVRNVEKVDSHG